MISLQAFEMVLETPSTYSLWLLLDNTSQSKLKAAILTSVTHVLEHDYYHHDNDNTTTTHNTTTNNNIIIIQEGQQQPRQQQQQQ